jgi:hypothetical protein
MHSSEYASWMSALGLIKTKDQAAKMGIESVTDNHPVLARAELEFCKGKNAVFSSRHHELLMETSLIQCLLVLMKQLDLVESDFEPVKHQQDLF